MTNPKYFRVAILIAAALAASGCGIFKKGSGPKTPVLGQRIAVLTSEGDVQVDPATAALPMTLPPKRLDAGTPRNRFRASAIRPRAPSTTPMRSWPSGEPAPLGYATF